MIVINFATGHYLKGQERLSKSLGDHKKLMLNDYTSIGSPTHSQSPYEFKVHAIEKAFKFDPIVLWVDASMWLVGDLSVIENIILEDGYFMSEAGHYVKDWCNAHARSYFKFNGSESHFTMFSAGLLGLDSRNELAMEFLKQWKASAKAGCFRGSWKDHRHDMSAGSIIAQRLGMKYQRGGQHMSYIGEGYTKPEPDSIFYLQGI